MIQPPLTGQPRPPSEPPEDGSGASGDAPVPRDLAGRVGRISRQAPPPPKGRGIVIALIAAAMVWALIDTFTGGGGASKAIEESREESGDPTPPSLPFEEGGMGVSDLKARLDDAARQTPGAPLARTDVELPDGLPEALATRLQQSLGVLPAVPLGHLAEVATEVRRIPAQIAEAPEALRAPLAAKALSLFARNAVVAPIRPALLESAVWLARQGLLDDAAAPDVATLRKAAVDQGLASDAEAPAALAFLAVLPLGADLAALDAIDDVIADAARPLHVRIAAARVRPREGRGPRLWLLADDAATHPLLREALSGGE